MKLLLIIFITVLFISKSLYAQEKEVKKDETKTDQNLKTKVNQQLKFPLLENSGSQNLISSKSEELKRKQSETDSLANEKGIPKRKTLKDGTVLILDRFENGVPIYSKIGFVNNKSNSKKQKK